MFIRSTNKHSKGFVNKGNMQRKIQLTNRKESSKSLDHSLQPMYQYNKILKFAQD